MNKQDLKSLTLEEMKMLFIDTGYKGFRGEQVFRRIHNKLANSIEEITELSKELRDKLKNCYKIDKLEIFKRFDSKLDNTKKYLFLLNDGNLIESVMMEYKHGVSVCLSTQVGCKMGCQFCASTKEGFIRDLSAGEILDQVYEIQKDIGKTISSIVLMGTGEPLDNYSNVKKFLKIIHDKNGQNIGYRHITLSTCGIVPQIYDLADEELPITLAISLHSPYEEARMEIMPISKKYSIKEIIEACKYYIDKTNRRITFEYTLIKDVNDSIKDAEAIVRLLKNLLCHVNLIPLNPISEVKLHKSLTESVTRFKEVLEKNGIPATVRREMGGDVNAACGQLRRDYLDSEEY